jgi:hypothetical protein
LDLYTYDLDRIHTAPIGERHNFFLRFCRFYGRDLRPFVEWVIEQDFRRDRVHDTFWTTDIVGALNPFVVADPRNYAEGAEAWYALNQRIQEILTMQYWSVSPYALAQLEIVKLRIYFFMEDLNRENALGYQDTIAWLNQILDDHLSLRRYLDAEGWILYPPMLRDLNTAIDAGIVRVLDDVMGVVEPVRLWPERGRPLDNAQENLLGLMGTGSGMFFM